MSYLVVETRPAYAVVLTQDGSFLKVANLHYEVGQTVEQVVPLKLPAADPAAQKRHAARRILSLAAAAACFMLLLVGILSYIRMPFASVYLTINPQVRIDVNRKDAVVTVEGMNDDGAALLAGYDHRKKDLDIVMDELVDRAIDMGYLHEGGHITLDLDGSAEWVAGHGDHLNAHLSDHLADRITVTIDIAQKTDPAPSAPPAEPIVIPVGPGSYSDSDYAADEPEDGHSDYEDGDSPYDEDSASDYGVSDYEPDEEGDAESDYGMTDYETGSRSDYGDSAYDSSDYDEPDRDSFRSYEDDADSDYDDGDSFDS